jgi:DNA-binding transcriptional ArsR family regulator
MSSEDPGPGHQAAKAEENARFPGVRQVTDARTLRALAHPVRIALLEALVIGGAMTATEVSERIGESPTTCSFHLRQLAKYGFVEEAGGGVGRARPWRMTSIGMSFAPGGDPEAKVAAEAALRLFRERQFARYQTWRATQASYPQEWRDASEDSAFMFYLTAGELEQMGREVSEVLMRWFRLEGRMEDPSRRPPDALPVETLVVSYPTAPPQPAK